MQLTRRIATLIVSALFFVPSLVALPAHAAFHLATIDEVMSGLDGTDDVQFVEIRMLAGGQGVVTGSKLSAFGADGTFLRVVLTVPSNVTGASGGAWIMGSTDFAAEAGIAPDFTFASSGGQGLVPEDGMVCWGKPADQTNPANYIDCVSYGAYTGGANAHTSAPSASNPFGHSLVRTSETDDSSADFECADPAIPENNAAATGSIAASAPCAVCGNDTAEGLEECDGSDDALCPGECLGGCACPNVCGNDTVEGAEVCDGTDDSTCPGLCQVNCSCGPDGALGKDPQKCVKAVAKNASKIITLVGKTGFKCVKGIAAGKVLTDVATCAALDAGGKIAGALAKLTSQIADLCSFPYAVDCPDNPCGATDVDGVSEAADNDTEVGNCLNCQSASTVFSVTSPDHGVHSGLLNGTTVALKADNKALAKCQGLVLKATDKHVAIQAKTYAGCLVSELKQGATPPVGAACIGNDPKDKILKASGKLTTAIEKCEGAAPFDGGICSGLADMALAACIESHSVCRGCEWGNALMGSNVICSECP